MVPERYPDFTSMGLKYLEASYFQSMKMVRGEYVYESTR
jgi:hypothetical protein